MEFLVYYITISTKIKTKGMPAGFLRSEVYAHGAV